MALHRQSGSLPLVLLAAIILGGLVVALFTVVQSSQRSSGRDRDVNQSIQVADAGVQEAFVRLAVSDELPDGDPLAIEPGQMTASPMTGLAGEGSYSWEAYRRSIGLWEVRSVGTYRTHSTVVEALVGWQSQFPFALWGDSRAGIRAGNAELGHLGGGLPAMGSNGPVVVPNSWTPPQSTIVPDEVTVECWGEDAEANCSGIDGADRNTSESLEFADIAAAAYAAPGENADVDFAGSCWNEELEKEIDDGPYDPSEPLERGHIYCFSQVVFDRGADPVLLTGDSPDPVRIFIRPTPEGGVSEAALIVGGTGSNHAVVNWEPAGLSSVDFKANPSLLQSSAADLIIAVGGTRLVSFENNSSVIAAGIYAPRARCEIRTQVTVVGGMICGEIPTTGPGSSSGDWTLYYDPELAELSVDGVYSIRRWGQGTCSDSSFSWATPGC